MNNNFKKLVRNLRNKEYEKIRFVRNNAIINDGEESKKSEIQQKKNTDFRGKRNG
jgi:hypothetical protein